MCSIAQPFLFSSLNKFMEKRDIKQLLDDVAAGEVSPDDALLSLRHEPFAEMGYAKVDTHRSVRQGVSEIIYGEGKTSEQIIGIVRTLLESGDKRVLITRMQSEKAQALNDNLVVDGIEFLYDAMSRVGVVGCNPQPDGGGKILVVAAGTSDIPVALEAAQTAEFLGNEVIRRFDVGVAGVHRLLAFRDEIFEAKVIIAVAGMEGALASVVGGLANCPIIAVPTSVGYGSSFEGLAALLAMLNSCASGVSVVNIDNGFGAGYQAHLINHAF